jgi:hypothetical protein
MSKSREIGDTIFFKNIQLEWLSYYIRFKTFERGCDLMKFKDILKMKKEKIDNYAFKKQIPSIFSNESMIFQHYINEFYPSAINLPNFQYSPKNGNLKHWDLFYFYKRFSKVEYMGEIRTVTYNDVKKQLVWLDGYMQIPYLKVKVDINGILSDFSNDLKEI